MRISPHLLFTGSLLLAACDQNTTAGSMVPKVLQRATPTPIPATPEPKKKSGDWMFDPKHRGPLDPPLDSKHQPGH